MSLNGSLWLSLILCTFFVACVTEEAPPDRRSFTTTTLALSACPDGGMLDGIDVSKWQGYVDWEAVAEAGIDFAFIRVSDGLDYQDAYFQSNWSEAKAQGIVRGAYQFFRSDEDPVAQAQYLLDEMGPLEAGDLPPVCDVETADGQSPAVIAERVQTWLDVVEDALGVKPLIYTSPGVWGSIINSADFGAYPLWVAHWGASCPTMPTGWSDWIFWQTSDSGSVPGVSGNVDTNHFNGDLDALLEFAYQGGDTSPAPESESATPCPVVAEGQTLIEEDGPCARRLGALVEEAYVSVGGGSGHAWWTLADELAPAYQEGVAWLFDFELAGTYGVWAHVPAALDDLSTGAIYEISHGGDVSVVEVNLRDNAGKAVLLGTFDFSEGSAGQEVRALDSYTAPGDAGKRVSFDTLELGLASYCACLEAGLVETLICSGGSEIYRECDGCSWSDWSDCPGVSSGEDASDGEELDALVEHEEGDIGPERSGNDDALDLPDSPRSEGSERPSVSGVRSASTVQRGRSELVEGSSGCALSEPKRSRGDERLALLLMLCLGLYGFKRWSKSATP